MISERERTGRGLFPTTMSSMAETATDSRSARSTPSSLIRVGKPKAAMNPYSKPAADSALDASSPRAPKIAPIRACGPIVFSRLNLITCGNSTQEVMP